MESSLFPSFFQSNYFWWTSRLLIPSFMTFFFYRMFFWRRCANLHGKVVLITGASSGLGEALAHLFYDAGCKVILASRNEVSLLRVKNDLSRKHQENPNTFPAVVLPLDLTDLKRVNQFAAEAVSIYRHVDLLINNAGMGYRGSIVSTSTEVDYQIMLVNYLGQVALTKALLPSMIDRSSGHIVFVSSIQGKFSIPFRSAYAVSKHALQAFSDSLHAEMAVNNINVTTVSPGYIRTNLSINAVTGSGKKYGVMDDTTASGYSADYIANKILLAVIKRKNEIIIAPFHHKLIIYLRTFFPSLYFFIMRFRARSTRTLNEKQS